MLSPCHSGAVVWRGWACSLCSETLEKDHNLDRRLLPKLFQLLQLRLNSSLETWLLSDPLSLPHLPRAVLWMSSSAGQVV